MGRVEQIPIESVTAVSETQPREALNEETVREYMQALDNEQALPPLVVFRDHDGGLWLADGFHRLEARHRRGEQEIDAEIHEGGLNAARWYAAGANAAHGLRPSPSDKRRCVRMAMEAGPDLSNRAIAKHCGVGQHLVREVRQELAPDCARAQSSRRQGLDGRTINTAQIGRAPAPAGDDSVPEPVQVPENQPSPPLVGPQACEQGGEPEPIGVESFDDDFEDGGPQPQEPQLPDASRLRALIESLAWHKREIKRLVQEPGGQGVAYQSAWKSLTDYEQDLKHAVPHAICPTCKGAACRHCGQKGWVTAGAWKASGKHRHREAPAQ